MITDCPNNPRFLATYWLRFLPDIKYNTGQQFVHVHSSLVSRRFPKKVDSLMKIMQFVPFYFLLR